MKKITRAGLLSAAIGALWLPVAHAQQADEVTYKFSGFGTVGAAVQNNDKADFRSSVTKYSGAGTTPDFGVDTRAGVQGSAIIGRDLTVTGQVYAARRGDKDLDPEVEWFFAQYKAAPWLDVRAGRMVLPVYLVSDFRNVGYAMPWLRAPGEVYSSMPISHFDGFQAIVRVPVGDAQLSIQPSFGRAKTNVKLATVMDLDYKPIGGLNVSMEYGDWLVRAGQVRINVDISSNAVSPPINISGSDKFTTVGLQFDNGSALFISEYAKRQTEVFRFNSTAWYATAGWHLGKWLPNLTYARLSPKGPDYTSQLATHSVSLGVRYDAAKNVALKAQIEQRGIDPLNFGLPSGTGRYGDKVNLLSLAADFVF